ncbi:membrane protein PM19L-like [Wolffia australiana]
MAGKGLRNVAAPLLFLNFLLYAAVVFFASWNLNNFIDGLSHHPAVAGNGATFYFLVFAILAGVIGVASKLAGGNHVRSWRSDSLAAAAASALVAWAVTALAFGLACKEIHIGGYRGWRMRVLEGLIIAVTFTQLLYSAVVHAGIYRRKFGPGYGNPPYGPAGGEPIKGGVGGTPTV